MEKELVFERCLSVARRLVSPKREPGVSCGTWLGRWTFHLLGAFVAVVSAGAADLVNGGLHSGTLAAGGSDSWTFSAAAGAGVMVRVGGTNFTPRIRVFDPANALVREATSNNSGVRDTVLTMQAASSGSYTVVISAAFPNQAGSYGVSLAQAPGTVQTFPGDQGGALTNGFAHAGEIVLGDLDVYTFLATANNSVMLRVGSPSLTPWIRVLDPNGALAGEATSNNSGIRDTALNLQATNAGIYTVVVSAAFNGQVGTYGLSLAQAPGGIVVSPEDQGGVLTNGYPHAGEIKLGELDVYTFSAGASSSVMLRMGSTTLTPWIRVFDPNGALAGEATSNNSGIRDIALSLQATNAGVYTVVVSSAFSGQVGTYSLSFAEAPGDILVAPLDQGGVLTNGLAYTGEILLGELDVYTFSATDKNSVMLRMGSSTLTPFIRVFDPNGALAGDATSNNSGIRDTSLNLQATNAGIYTVVVSSAFSGQVGTYGLSFAKAPGDVLVTPSDQGGMLTNGFAYTGELQLGELDAYTFSAGASNSVMLRMGSGTLTPWIRVFDPNGALAGEALSNNSGIRDTSLNLQATNAGIYTVVVSAAFSGQVGSYELSFARAPGEVLVSPGDQGGLLVNGVTNSSTLNVGDLDVWSFFGTPGDSNALRVVATTFTPWLRLYGPTGQLLEEVRSSNSGIRSATLSKVITESGSYTIVVSAAFANQAGDYTFKQSRVPPDLTVPDTLVVNETATLNTAISAQDPDEPVKPLQFDLISFPQGMNRTVGGATNANISWVTTEADGPSTNVVVATVTDRVNGVDFKRTNSFTIIVREINTPPTLIVPGNQTIDELTPLNVSVSATDADLPTNPLTFSLASAPAGMTIDPARGTIAWLPTEADGPSTAVVAVVVTDDSPSAANETHLSVTNTFTVTVHEVNLPPVLGAQNTRTIDELTTLTLTNSASDPDLPLNGLNYVLVDAPPGAVISPQGGLITWTPTEDQGPSTNLFTSVVTDSGSPSLRATNTFTVIVNEVNTPPSLQSIADQTLHYGTLLTVPVIASDSDKPTNRLTFTITQGPTNLTVDANSGVITWTPDLTQVGDHSVTVRVSDDGSPSLNATSSFKVTVEGTGAKLAIEPGSNGFLQLTATGDQGNNYELQKSITMATNTWAKVIQFTMLSSSFKYEVNPATERNNFIFYRLKLVQ